MLRAFWSTVVLIHACLAVGCFKFHGRSDIEAAVADAGSDGGSVDASARDSGIPSMPACSLQITPRPAVQIPTQSVEPDLGGATVFGNRLWVGWTASLSALVESTGRQLVIVDADSAATLQSSHAVMSLTSSWFYSGGTSFAKHSDGRTGLIAWDESNGCRFESLSDSGQVTFGPLRVGDNNCSSLRTTRDGYSFFESSAGEVRIVHITPDGDVISRSEVIESLRHANTRWTTAMDRDETYYTAMELGGDDSVIRIAHVDGSGSVMSLFDPIVLGRAPIGPIRIALFDDHVVAMWSEPTLGADDDRVAALQTASFTTQGRNVASSPVAIANHHLQSNYSLVTVGGRLYAAYVTPPDGEPTETLQRVDLIELDGLGARTGGPTPLTREFAAVRDPTLRETPHGAILVFRARSASELESGLYALPMGCAPALDDNDGTVVH